MRRTFGEITVTVARARDALPLLALQREVLAEGDWFITLPDELTITLEQKTEQIRAMGISPNSAVWVARLPHVQVAGAVTVVGGQLRRMRHVGKLEIMVHPHHRGAGVGKALLASAIAWAEENALLTKLGLSVFATNTRAIALYRRFGFEEEGLRCNEYRMEDGSYRDDVLMWRSV